MSGEAQVSGVPASALDAFGVLIGRLANKRLAVFLDYDGTLTPIVDRPEDAVISEAMRDAVRALARHCTVCVVSGRDRPVVQELMGVDDLIVAGSHGFDIWSPGGEAIERHAAEGFEDLIRRVTGLLRERTGSIDGALVEPKRSSVAVHYRLVDERARPLVTAAVEKTMVEHADALKVTPGEMVFEIQPNIEWDKGKAVLHLLAALGLDRDDVVPLYIGDDINDEHAFAAIADRGVGILVADPDDPEVHGRTTAAAFALRNPREVQDLLAALARTGTAGEPEPADDRFGSAAEREGPRAERRAADRRESNFAGAVFDVDGVLVDSPHERAWRETLRELMEGEWRELQPQTTYKPELFTTELYQERVAGKPRMAGALAVMQSFGIPDPQARAQEYGERKQQRIIELAGAGEFAAFPDALRFVLAVRAAGIPIATASSSKNATLFLRAIRLDTFAAEQDLRYDFLGPGLTLLDFVDADISGRDFKRGKPDPEIFLTAAADLGAPPERCFVVEDAVSGIAAAKAARMAALGVARADDRALLEAAAADLVVTALDQVDIEALAAGRLAPK